MGRNCLRCGSCDPGDSKPPNANVAIVMSVGDETGCRTFITFCISLCSLPLYVYHVLCPILFISKFYASLILFFLFRAFSLNSFSSSFMFSVISVFHTLIISYVFPTSVISIYFYSFFCFSVFSYFICVKLFLSLILFPSTSFAILFTIPAFDALFFFVFHPVFAFTLLSLLLSSSSLSIRLTLSYFLIAVDLCSLY